MWEYKLFSGPICIAQTSRFFNSMKKNKDQKQGEVAYQGINHQAVQLLQIRWNALYFIVFLSFSRGQLLQTINKAGRHIDRYLKIIGQSHQGPDQPNHSVLPETEYLHAFFVRVLHS